MYVQFAQFPATIQRMKLGRCGVFPKFLTIIASSSTTLFGMFYQYIAPPSVMSAVSSHWSDPLSIPSSIAAVITLRFRYICLHTRMLAVVLRAFDNSWLSFDAMQTGVPV